MYITLVHSLTAWSEGDSNSSLLVEAIRCERLMWKYYQVDQEVVWFWTPYLLILFIYLLIRMFKKQQLLN